MTDRLSDITARIDGIQQLGAVVNAMRGIAAARAQQARAALAAVDSYTATIARAVGQVLALAPPGAPAGDAAGARLALVLFCAEQGFAGAFSERVLAAAGPDLAAAALFLVGTRGQMALAECGISAAWKAAMPSHAPGIPDLADRVVRALYCRIATGTIDRLDAIFSLWRPGHGTSVTRVRLFPFDLTVFPQPKGTPAPLLEIGPVTLMHALTADYMHAQLCRAALHAFAAENEARMQAMAAARDHVERQLASLQARQRLVRQEEITAEVIELAAGETAGQGPDPLLK